MRVAKGKDVPQLRTNRLYIGFRVGSQYFTPRRPYENQSQKRHDSRGQPWVAGPTRPSYPQASTSIQGPATLGIRANSSGNYYPRPTSRIGRVHNTVHRIPESVSSALLPDGPRRPSTFRPGGVDVIAENPSETPADQMSSGQLLQKIKGLSLGRGNPEFSGQNIGEVPMQGEISRSSSGQRYYTPPEYPTSRVHTAASRAIDPASASIMDMDDSIIDCQTVVRRPKKAPVRLPSNWMNQSHTGAANSHGMQPTTSGHQDPGTDRSRDSTTSGYRTALEYQSNNPGPSGTQAFEPLPEPLQPMPNQPGPSPRSAEQPQEMTVAVRDLPQGPSIRSLNDMTAMYLRMSEDPNFADNIFRQMGLADASEEEKQAFVRNFRDSLLNGSNPNIDPNYRVALYDNLRARLQEVTAQCDDIRESLARQGITNLSPYLNPIPSLPPWEPPVGTSASGPAMGQQFGPSPTPSYATQYSTRLNPRATSFTSRSASRTCSPQPTTGPENINQAEDSNSSTGSTNWRRRRAAKVTGQQGARGNASNQQSAGSGTSTGGKGKGKAKGQPARQASNSQAGPSKLSKGKAPVRPAQQPSSNPSPTATIARNQNLGDNPQKPPTAAGGGNAPITPDQPTGNDVSPTTMNPTKKKQGGKKWWTSRKPQGPASATTTTGDNQESPTPHPMASATPAMAAELPAESWPALAPIAPPPHESRPASKNWASAPMSYVNPNSSGTQTPKQGTPMSFQARRGTASGSPQTPSQPPTGAPRTLTRSASGLSSAKPDAKKDTTPAPAPKEQPDEERKGG